MSVRHTTSKDRSTDERALTRSFGYLVASSTAIVALTGCSGEAAQSAPQVDRAEIVAGKPAPASVPRGATINPSGYATILSTPPATTIASPLPVPRSTPPPPPTNGRGTPQPMTTEAVAARERLMNPDDAARSVAFALDRRLKAAERANYVGVRVVRDPRPRFAFQFRRDAATSLARYTRDPRFTTREGGIPTPELQPIFDTWRKRFEPFRLTNGGGVYQFDGVVRFEMSIDEAGFREIATRERWTLPERLELVFSPPRNASLIDPALSRYVRVFPREDRLPASGKMALVGGRIILRDGCFRLTEHGQAGEPLVIFGRDVELGLDDQNYMVLARSGSKEPAPRIGEPVTWGGPNYHSEADLGVKALRAKCGAEPIVAVGRPDSAARWASSDRGIR